MRFLTNGSSLLLQNLAFASSRRAYNLISFTRLFNSFNSSHLDLELLKKIENDNQIIIQIKENEKSVSVDSFLVDYPNLLDKLKTFGYINLFPIQKYVFNAFLEKKNILLRSQTGSGKTLAYLLPIATKYQNNSIMKIKENEFVTRSKSLSSFDNKIQMEDDQFLRELEIQDSSMLWCNDHTPLLSKFSAGIFSRPKDVIICPTIDLAIQVYSVATQLLPNGFVALAVGEKSIMPNWLKELENCSLAIVTPGRFINLVKYKILKPTLLESLIIDECDSFEGRRGAKLFECVGSFCSGAKNTSMINFCLVSATVPYWLYGFKSSLFGKRNEHGSIFIDQVAMLDSKIPKSISHFVFPLEANQDRIEKVRQLCIAILSNNDQIRNILGSNNEKAYKTLVIVSSVKEVDELSLQIPDSAALHSKMSVYSRERVLFEFENGTIPILITSNLGGRGLDITGISIVVIASCSDDPIDYIHKCGRTGRNGMKGVSIVFSSLEEIKKLKNIENHSNIRFSPFFL